MTTMRAAVWLAPDQIEVRQVERPELPDGWALVKLAYNGICGSDLAVFHGQHPRAKPPLIPGHEMAGWVADPGTTGLATGTLVIAAPLISCGSCRACRTGNPHVCNRLTLYGIDAPGGMAEYVALPADVLYPLPAEVDARTAALAEPLAVAVHALSLSDLRPGDVAAVWGAGPIGMLTALMARYSGASEVVVCEPNDWRRSVAAEAGFTVAANPAELAGLVAARTDDEGVDVTFDCAAHPAVSPELCAGTRVRGRVVIVGVYKKPSEIVLRDICFKELTMVGVRVYTPGDVQFAVDLIARGGIDLSLVPTRAFPLESAAAAYRAATGGEDSLKVLVTPWDDLADRAEGER